MRSKECIRAYSSAEALGTPTTVASMTLFGYCRAFPHGLTLSYDIAQLRPLICPSSVTSLKEIDIAVALWRAVVISSPPMYGGILVQSGLPEDL